MPYIRAVALFLSAAMVSGCSSYGSSLVGSRAGSAVHHRASSSPIQHIVIIMQENRSFDNMFYKYPGADYATQGTGHDVLYPLVPINLGFLHDQNHYHYQFLVDLDRARTTASTSKC